jgi:hypothetical protein
VPGIKESVMLLSFRYDLDWNKECVKN